MKSAATAVVHGAQDLAGRFERLAGKLSVQQAEARRSESVRKIDEAIAVVDAKLKTIDEARARRSAEIGARLAETDTQMARIDTRMAEIDARLAELDAQMLASPHSEEAALAQPVNALPVPAASKSQSDFMSANFNLPVSAVVLKPSPQRALGGFQFYANAVMEKQALSGGTNRDLAMALKMLGQCERPLPPHLAALEQALRSHVHTLLHNLTGSEESIQAVDGFLSNDIQNLFVECRKHGLDEAGNYFELLLRYRGFTVPEIGA